MPSQIPSQKHRAPVASSRNRNRVSVLDASTTGPHLLHVFKREYFHTPRVFCHVTQRKTTYISTHTRIKTCHFEASWSFSQSEYLSSLYLLYVYSTNVGQTLLDESQQFTGRHQYLVATSYGKSTEIEDAMHTTMPI